MRRVLSTAVLGTALLVLGVSPAAASQHRARSCSAADKAGNWEVVLGTGLTSKAASRLVTRASAKRLHAVVERIGCSRRYEAEITVATRARASTTLAKARKDGFKTATMQKS